jgi:hypothetical protein
VAGHNGNLRQNVPRNECDEERLDVRRLQIFVQRLGIDGRRRDAERVKSRWM